MLNKSYRISTPLVQPIKSSYTKSTNFDGVSKKIFNVPQPEILSKSVSCNDYVKSPLPTKKSSIGEFNSYFSSSTKSNLYNHNEKQKLFKFGGNQLRTNYRHQTVLTAGVRTYATTEMDSEMKMKRNELPESVKRLVKEAPKTGYNGESIDHMLKEGNYDKRQFGYFLANSGRFIAAAGIRLAVLRFLYSWGAAADVLALATIEVDVSNVPKGKTITVTWRGKPVFIKHRTDEELQFINDTPVDSLRDPQADSERFKNPAWTIVIAICTHLGCVPVTDAGEYDAFFCPCHGSHYDAAGRIMKGPAPLNLEVPKHSFDGDDVIVLG